MRTHQYFGSLVAAIVLLCPIALLGSVSNQPLLDSSSLSALRAQLPDLPGALVVIGRASPGTPTVVQTLTGAGAVTFDTDSDKVFEIGSITKVFTALVLSDMVRHGEIALTDPIDKCLPPGVTAPAFQGRQITFLDLADHHSGLPRMPPNLGFLNFGGIANYTPAQMYRALSSYTLTRAPGAVYEYSNWGVGLLGQLLANCSGTSYANLVEQRVIVPLGLRSTTVPPPHAPLANLVPAFDADGNPQPAMTWNASIAAAGAIRSTVSDLLKLGEACLPGASGPVADDCHFAMIPRADAGRQQARVGLVLETEDKDGIIWHNGATAGYHAYLGIDGATSTVVAILNNTGASIIDQIGFHVLNAARAIPRPAAAATVEAKLLDAYAGRYRVADGSGLVLSIERTGNGLRAVIPNSGQYRLEATGPDAFVTRERMTVVFCTRRDGVVYALSYTTFGKTNVALRLNDRAR